MRRIALVLGSSLVSCTLSPTAVPTPPPEFQRVAVQASPAAGIREVQSHPAAIQVVRRTGHPDKRRRGHRSPIGPPPAENRPAPAANPASPTVADEAPPATTPDSTPLPVAPPAGRFQLAGTGPAAWQTVLDTDTGVVYHYRMVGGRRRWVPITGPIPTRPTGTLVVPDGVRDASPARPR